MLTLRTLAAESRRPVSFTLHQEDARPEHWRVMLDALDAAAQDGLDIKAQVSPRSIGAFMTFRGTLHPFLVKKSFRDLLALPFKERIARLRDPDVRTRILAEPGERLSTIMASVTPKADGAYADPVRLTKRLFVLEDRLDYEQPFERSVFAMAQRQGVDPIGLMYDLMLERDGTNVLFSPAFEYSHFNYEASREMLSHPRSIMGLSDSGAHVGYVCDGSFSTYMLNFWARDRERGAKLPLERCVALQTSIPARHLGLIDRGVLEAGMRADLNVIDFDRLDIGYPKFVNDLPAGGGRFLETGSGYLATLVAGTVVTQHDTLTDERPGRLIRAGLRHSRGVT